MNSVNKTMYIPLYGKSVVSRKGLFLSDPRAERIWEQEGFPLGGKSASKWLAYTMGIRAAVFDDWLRAQMEQIPDGVVLHIGCGMDSRVLRVGTGGHCWYDVDFPEVIRERRHYFEEGPEYRMLGADVRQKGWLDAVSGAKDAIVVMEGVSMYLTTRELLELVQLLTGRFDRIHLLMDCYTELAAKVSRYKNPINEVGVTRVYGLDQPQKLNHGSFRFTAEMDMVPQRYVRQLQGMEQRIFKTVFAGPIYGKLYRLYEFRSE